jgi:hypothetical protein
VTRPRIEEIVGDVRLAMNVHLETRIGGGVFLANVLVKVDAIATFERFDREIACDFARRDRRLAGGRQVADFRFER